MKNFRTVPDTNVIIAGHKSKSETSPNKEYINLWLKTKIELLYSDDTFSEYIEKLKSRNTPDNIIVKFFIAIMELVSCQMSIQV